MDEEKRKKARREKEEKRKPKYGLFSCVGYIYRLLWRTERGLVFTGIVTVPLTVTLSALALYTPPTVLRALEQYSSFSYVAWVIFGLLFAKLLFDLANQIVTKKIESSEHFVLMQMQYVLNVYRRTCDWYVDLYPEVVKQNERADAAVGNNHTAGVHFPMDFANLLGTILNFILFGFVVFMLHPLIIALLVAGCAVNYAAGAWERK